MKRLKMTAFSIRFPWIIITVSLAAALFFGAQFPKVSFDNDPENMLAEDEHIRVFHNEVKNRYKLYDFVIVGIVNERHEDGIFNVETLGRIDGLTRELISLHRDADGLPAVMRDGEPYAPALEQESAWKRALATFPARKDKGSPRLALARMAEGAGNAAEAIRWREEHLELLAGYPGV